jgi:hypothetical protein
LSLDDPGGLSWPVVAVCGAEGDIIYSDSVVRAALEF